MLAFELYLKNKDSKSGDPKSLKPIKKIIYQNNTPTIDKKTIEEYGSEISDKFQAVQEWLSMPLTTCDASLLNLPDFRRSPAQPNPYFEIYCTLKTNKSKESILTLSIGKKPNTVEYSLDINSGEISKKTNSNVKLKIDSNNYKISNNNLFDKYVESKLIDENGVVNKNIFEEIVTRFFDYAKRKSLENPKIGSQSFSIFVLPSNGQIIYQQKEQKKLKIKNEPKSFTDAFGNISSEYASTSTKTSPFLSFDDKAFTINCMKGENFYQNLGIGKASLDKVYFPKDQTFNISGMNWVFTDISNNYYKFKDTRHGIFSQLFDNYKIISEKQSPERKKAILKIICFKSTQKKLEILIDENLTMDKMKRMFSNLKPSEIPNHAFEVLIETSGKTTLWNHYIYTIKNFLSETKLPKDYLLAIFSKMIKQKIYDWLKLKTGMEQKEFFLKSDFCLKHLSVGTTPSSFMNSNEEFAFNVGQIARHYIEFKQKIKEESNSLKDILTYSKYDREKLRFVIQRIGIGINLAKANDSDISNITKIITSLQPKEEISDNESQKDFSYFFYKGYYTNQEVLA